MKSLLLVSFVFFSAIDAFGQGAFEFRNRATPLIDAPVFDTDCQTRLEGPAFLWQVYGGLTSDTLQPLGEVLPFGTGAAAGYIPPRGYVVEGATVNQLVYSQLRAWEATAGSTFGAAVESGGKYGLSNIVPIVAVEAVGTVPPQIPVGLESFCLIPEPSTLTLLVCAGCIAGGAAVRKGARVKPSADDVGRLRGHPLSKR